MIGRSISREPPIVALVVAALVATVASSAIAASMDALGLLLVVLLAVGALAVAIMRPILLFYAYCAAIPFNFALPPGPAGTVARIAGLAFFVGYLIREPDSLRPNLVPLVGWLFVGWTLASCLWAIDSGTAFAAWLPLAQLFAISVLVATIVSRDTGVIRVALWSYALSAAVTAAIGSIEYLQSPVIFLTRAASFSGEDPALFASILLPAIIILMWEVQSRTTGLPVRLAALGALLVCIAGLALSGTRSGWIGVIAAVIVWLLLQRSRRQVFPLVALVFGVAILVVAVPGLGDFLVGRAETSVATGGAGRTDIWAVGLYILTTAPLLGVGFGNFPLAFSPYMIAQASAGLAPIYVLSSGRGPHNVLLGTSVETGVVGGLLLVLFFASALWQPVGRPVTNVIRAILVGLFVQSFFLDILDQKQLWLFLAIALGLSATGHARRFSIRRGFFERRERVKP
jgi:hypothetical protein